MILLFIGTVFATTIAVVNYWQGHIDYATYWAVIAAWNSINYEINKGRK